MTVSVRVVVPGQQSGSDLGDAEHLDAPPTEPSGSLPEDMVQDIVVSLPSDSGEDSLLPPVAITFDMSQGDLRDVVAEVADSVFVTSGFPGLRELQAAFRGTGRSPAPGSVLMPVPGRGATHERDPRSPHRARLVREFGYYEANLLSRLQDAETLVQERAVTSARRRLEASREQVLTEALRYLSVAGGSASNAAAVLSGSAQNRLTGPEVLGLVTDLITIANAREQHAAAVAVQVREQRAHDAAREDRLASVRAGASPQRSFRPGLADAMARDIEAMKLDAQPAPALAAAMERAEESRDAIITLVLERASARPVLHRLWNTDVPFLARRLIRESRGGSTIADRAALAGSSELRAAVVNSLRITWRSAGELLARLPGDPELVWQFPPLIEDALDSLYFDDADFVARAARERLRREEPARELMGLSDWLGHAQLVFAVTGAEPVAVAASVAQVVVDLAGFAQKVLYALEQQTGEDAFLRPADRLGVPPTYSSLVMDALDITLNVWGSAADLRLLRSR